MAELEKAWAEVEATAHCCGNVSPEDPNAAAWHRMAAARAAMLAALRRFDEKAIALMKNQGGKLGPMSLAHLVNEIAADIAALGTAGAEEGER
jgi:hypothetical protein